VIDPGFSKQKVSEWLEGQSRIWGIVWVWIVLKRWNILCFALSDLRLFFTCANMIVFNLFWQDWKAFSVDSIVSFSMSITCIPLCFLGIQPSNSRGVSAGVRYFESKCATKSGPCWPYQAWQMFSLVHGEGLSNRNAR
jgi:hypothetical protein